MRPRPVRWLSKALVLRAVTIASAPHGTRAQDSHYWTNQYGTQAQLLGGAVVGRAVDLSTAYYNPAGIVFVRKSSGVVLTTDAFQYQVLRLEGVGAGGEDVTNSRLTPRQSLLTGLLPSSWVDGRLAYVFLTRMGTRNQTLAQATLADGSSAATATYINEFNYWKIGLTFKGGVAIKYDPLSVGITYTTRRFQIPIGDGRVITTRAFTGLDLDNDASPDADIAADEDDKLGQSNHTLHAWNINHINAGISGDIIRAELTLGLGWSWGRRDISSGFDFDGADENNGLIGNGKPVDVVYRNLSFLVGFSF